MKFITPDFLLHGKTAKLLYHEHARAMPIIDYHCHLSAADIARDVTFGNLTNIWLDNDHYKWTSMRWNGIEERYITGDAEDYEKFAAYAATLPRCIGNPLHHWSHLELQKYFGFDGHLTKETALEVWELANTRLDANGLSAQQLMRQSDVELICTTDDPADDLCWHRVLREKQDFPVSVLPAFRPDKSILIEHPDFISYLACLGQRAGKTIDSLCDLLDVLTVRLDAFAALGCKVSDHGLTRIPFVNCTQEQASAIFQKRAADEPLSDSEIEQYQSFLLCWLAEQYTCRNWVMQLHFGVLRDINVNLYQGIGVDAGGDAISGHSSTDRLASLLGYLDANHRLPRTILYSINPNDNAAIATIAGCFQTSEARGKIQHGCAWWFNDTKLGMEAHLQMLASLGALGSFIGMLTDSRSFLSYARHDYFRRILCNYIGGLADHGEFPPDMHILGSLISDICYHNTKNYFGF